MPLHDKHETDVAPPEFEERLRHLAEEDALQARVGVKSVSVCLSAAASSALWPPLTGHQARIRESLLKAKLSDSEQLIAYMKSS